MLIEEVEDEDDCIHEGMEGSEGEVPRPLPRKLDCFPKDLPDLVGVHNNDDDDDDDDVEIKEGDRIFVALAALATEKHARKMVEYTQKMKELDIKKQ